MATLEEFLRNGALGPIHVGMTQAEAVVHLGRAPDESVQREPKILKYGGLQITFVKPAADAEPHLEHIGVYFRPPLEPLPELVALADFTGDSETSIFEVQAFLSRIGLSATVEKEGEDTRLTLPSGAQIVFNDQNLWSMHFVKRRLAAAKKQISVSIPEEAWHELSSLARKSNRSVAELCSQWIAQKAIELRPEPK